MQIVPLTSTTNLLTILLGIRNNESVSSKQKPLKTDEQIAGTVAQICQSHVCVLPVPNYKKSFRSWQMAKYEIE